MSADVNKGCAKRKLYVPWELVLRLLRVLASVHPRSGAYAVSIASSTYGFAPWKRATCKVVGYGGIDRRRTCA